jgi:hypothetical protein
VSNRQEFSKATKLQMWERCGGRCECGCGLKIIGRPEYDHYPIPAALGGPATVENGRVLDPKHHRQITSEKDVPAIAKSQRGFEKERGLRKSKRPFPNRPKSHQWGRQFE